MKRMYLKPNSGTIRIMAGILAGLIVFKGIVGILNYIYVEPIDSEWERILWHHYYEDEGKIDHLILGSSHVYCGIDPMMLDNLNGGYNFNLASSAQLMNGTFYLLREADKNNNLEHVYVELYYGCNVDERINTDLPPNWRNIDYMKMSVNKLNYIFSAAGIDNYVDTLLPFSRYRSNLDDWDYICDVLNSKSEDSYRSYQYHYDIRDGNGYDEYQDRGYFECTRVFLDQAKIYPQVKILGENPMDAATREYLYKVIGYCQKRNIPITLFISPSNELQLISTENYDNYTSQVKEIAEECNVAFYDFNLTKEEYLPIHDGKYFKDAEHLNSFGAELFTPFFHKVVSQEESENAIYFYESYAEKLQASKPEVYGLYYSYFENSSGAYRDMRIASNSDSDMQYRVVITPEEGNPYMVQDFDDNKEFTVPWEESGVCTITARLIESGDVVQTMEIHY